MSRILRAHRSGLSELDFFLVILFTHALEPWHDKAAFHEICTSNGFKRVREHAKESTFQHVPPFRSFAL